MYESTDLLVKIADKAQMNKFIKASKLDEEENGPGPGPNLGDELSKWLVHFNLEFPNPYEEDEDDEYGRWAVEAAVYDNLF